MPEVVQLDLWLHSLLLTSLPVVVRMKNKNILVRNSSFLMPSLSVFGSHPIGCLAFEMYNGVFMMPNML